MWLEIVERASIMNEPWGLKIKRKIMVVAGEMEEEKMRSMFHSCTRACRRAGDYKPSVDGTQSRELVFICLYTWMKYIG